METRFDELLVAVKEGFDGASDELREVKEDVKVLKEDVRIIKSTAVTKDYLDDKLTDLGAEIGRRIHMAAQRDKAFHLKMIEFLKKNKALSPEHAEELEEMLA